MSNDEALRRQTEDQFRNNPSMEKQTGGNYHDQQVVNNEIERQRREQEERSRRS